MPCADHLRKETETQAVNITVEKAEPTTAFVTFAAPASNGCNHLNS